MKIVWFSWKDIEHPQAGGAETISYQIMKRLVRDGHEVNLVTSRYSGSSVGDDIDGIKVTRVGNRYSVYLRAYRYFRKSLRDWPDLVVDEMNTLPFLASLFTKKRVTLFVHQLAREVWFYQAILPVAFVGYLLEPAYLFLLSRARSGVITVSDSTKQDLARYGFNLKNIRQIREGIEAHPSKLPTKPKNGNTVLCLGSIRPMKRTLHGIKAFEVAKADLPDIRLIIAGDDSGHYAEKVKRYCQKSQYSKDIEILGRVSGKKRASLLQEAKAIIATPVKEGWGLTVTEANSHGTPVVGYDVDGIRDSIQKDRTGVLVENGQFKELGEELALLLSDETRYLELRKNAFEYSKEFTFENSYGDFVKEAVITL